MELFDIVILAIIICVIYKYWFCTSKEDFKPEFQEYQEDEYSTNIEDANKYIDRLLKTKTKPTINKNFVEIQFHNDYKDTLSAFNNIVPCQSQMFNKSNLPVTAIEPNINEVKQLIVSFINEVNKNIKHQTGDDEISPIGWNDFKPEKKIESGWDRQQKALGLPTSVYKDGASKAPIKLVKIDHLEKYETDDETRHVTYLIIQKKNVDDQMVIRVSFVIDRNDLNIDREFFDSEKNFYETVVKIEEVFVVGFMSNSGKKCDGSRQDFYNFETIDNSEMLSDKDIVVALNKKKREYMNEINS